MWAPVCLQGPTPPTSLPTHRPCFYPQAKLEARLAAFQDKHKEQYARRKRRASAIALSRLNSSLPDGSEGLTAQSSSVFTAAGASKRVSELGQVLINATSAAVHALRRTGSHHSSCTTSTQASPGPASPLGPTSPLVTGRTADERRNSGPSLFVGSNNKVAPDDHLPPR